MKQNYKYDDINISKEFFLSIFYQLSCENINTRRFAEGLVYGSIYRISRNLADFNLKDKPCCFTNLYCFMFCFLRKYYYGLDINWDFSTVLKIERAVWEFIKTKNAKTQKQLSYILRDIDITSLSNSELYDKIEKALNETGYGYPDEDDIRTLQKFIQ